MKKVFYSCLLTGSFGLFFIVNAFAQDTTRKDTTTVGQDIKKIGKETGEVVSKEAKKVGNKTAELASKGKSGVVDKKYDGKVGPDGQTIYIDEHAKYYWIDKKGKRHYVTESELKNKAG